MSLVAIVSTNLLETDTNELFFSKLIKNFCFYLHSFTVTPFQQTHSFLHTLVDLLSRLPVLFEKNVMLHPVTICVLSHRPLKIF